jgi:hypothetical protein
VAAVDTIYPLSTADGKEIPLEVATPLFMFRMEITATQHAAVDLPNLECILCVSSNVDCIVSFGVDAVLPADGVIAQSLMYIPAGVIITLNPVDISMSVIGTSSNAGTLWVNGIQKWQALGKEVLFTRK